MTDIDPEEDKLMSAMIELVFSIFKTIFAHTDSLEQSQGLSKTEMEMQLMIDEILQIDAKARIRGCLLRK